MSPLPPAVPADPTASADPPASADQSASADRTSLRLRSLTWALLAALACGSLAAALATLTGGIGQPWPPGAGHDALDGALRAAGCGFFYGLLAFHLQRVDPDDGHLQAGLVGAICGVRSLGQPPPPAHPVDLAVGDLPSVMMGWLDVWLPLWLPLIGSALLLQSIQRVVPSLRP